MSYRVDLKCEDREAPPFYTLYDQSPAQMYFGDIGKSFETLAEASKYFLQFDDWEQPMLEIRNEDEIPF